MSRSRHLRPSWSVQPWPPTMSSEVRTRVDAHAGGRPHTAMRTPSPAAAPTRTSTPWNGGPDARGRWGRAPPSRWSPTRARPATWRRAGPRVVHRPGCDEVCVSGHERTLRRETDKLHDSLWGRRPQVIHRRARIGRRGLLSTWLNAETGHALTAWSEPDALGPLPPCGASHTTSSCPGSPIAGSSPTAS